MTDRFPSNFNIDFHSYDEFVEFLNDEPWFLKSDKIEGWVTDLLKTGFREPVTNTWFDPHQIDNATQNFREGIMAGSLNSRQRAMLQAIKELNPSHGGLKHCRIYGLEQASIFAARIKEQCPLFVGSEYLPEIAAVKTKMTLNRPSTIYTSLKQKLFPQKKYGLDAHGNSIELRHEDLLALSFPDNSFDVVFSNDVLEHVTNIDMALKEVCRVLRPNGMFICTFPFCYGQYDSVIKASMVGAEIIYHCEAEYHGNPMDPSGSLVFELPAWDILDRARAVGFQRSFVRATASKRYGYIGAGVPAVLINVFEK